MDSVIISLLILFGVHIWEIDKTIARYFIKYIKFIKNAADLRNLYFLEFFLVYFWENAML